MRDDHPVLTFAFVLANIVSTLGWLFLAGVVVPKVKLYSRLIKFSAMTTFGLSAVAHLAFALVVLFDPDRSAVQQAASPPVLLVQVGIAISMWLVLAGIFVQVGSYGLTPDVPATSEPGT